MQHQWTRWKKRLWTATLCLGCAFLYATRSAVPVTILDMAKEFNWSKTTSGTVLSSFLWGYCCTQVLGGYLADSIGGDVILWSAGIFWSLSTLLLPFIPMTMNHGFHATLALNFIILSRILCGLSQGMHYPAVSNLISTHLPSNEKTFVSGIVYSGGPIGIVLCGLIHSYITQTRSWHFLYLVTGSLSLIWVLFVRCSLLKMSNTHLLKSSIMEEDHRKKVPWSTILGHRAFWAMIIAHIAHDNSWYIIISWLPTFFVESYPNSPSWLFNSLPYVIAPVVSVISAMISEKLMLKGYTVTCIRKSMHTICQLTIIFPLLIIGQIDNFPTAILLVCIAIGGANIHCACLSVNPQDLAPEFAGSLFGLMNTAGAIPGFIGVYFAGYVQDVTGSWQAVFCVTAMINVIGAIVFLLFGSGKPIVKSSSTLVSHAIIS